MLGESADLSNQCFLKVCSSTIQDLGFGSICSGELKMWRKLLSCHRCRSIKHWMIPLAKEYWGGPTNRVLTKCACVPPIQVLVCSTVCNKSCACQGCSFATATNWSQVGSIAAVLLRAYYALHKSTLYKLIQIDALFSHFVLANLWEGYKKRFTNHLTMAHELHHNMKVKDELI